MLPVGELERELVRLLLDLSAPLFGMSSSGRRESRVGSRARFRGSIFELGTSWFVFVDDLCALLFLELDSFAVREELDRGGDWRDLDCLARSELVGYKKMRS